MVLQFSFIKPLRKRWQLFKLYQKREKQIESQVMNFIKLANLRPKPVKYSA